MVDSRNFKNKKTSYNKRYKNTQMTNGKKKVNPLLPLLVVIIMAVVLILIQYIMLDIMENVYEQSESESTSMIEYILS